MRTCRERCALAARWCRCAALGWTSEGGGSVTVVVAVSDLVSGLGSWLACSVGAVGSAGAAGSAGGSVAAVSVVAGGGSLGVAGGGSLGAAATSSGFASRSGVLARLARAVPARRFRERPWWCWRQRSAVRRCRRVRPGAAASRWMRRRYQPGSAGNGSRTDLPARAARCPASDCRLRVAAAQDRSPAGSMARG